MGQRSVWDGRVSLKEFEMSQDDLSRDRVMMCDVGGGMAHQCADLRKYRPELVGRIVSEDLELVQSMIANGEELKALGVELQQQDFMREQAVKDAKVYYLRNVIHNCRCFENYSDDAISLILSPGNDESSKVILSQISKAMSEDSHLILDEVVMPQLGLGWKQASMDLAMMTMLAAKERTEDEFERLLNGAGLTIKEIRTYDEDYGDSLIIAELLPAKVDEMFTNSPTKATFSSLSNGFYSSESNGIHNGESDGIHNGETNGVHNGETNGIHNGESNGVHVDESKDGYRDVTDGGENGQPTRLSNDPSNTLIE